ncbi:MAG: hypothetical protein MUF25_24650 [Pirellulaceae bacterium]|nr:hypothetical protein [Pirellulaceae bacterium]
MSCLLMGGQACVLYGAAEFSRDTDLVILPDSDNLARLQAALADLQAECIAVPPFDRQYLEMGLAVHFRCHHPEADGIRVDVMSKLRGVEEFSQLWPRRTTVIVDGEPVELLSLPDLVRAKKTQRDKDWPMIARLVEANYFQHRDDASPQRVRFWLLEMRTPALLVEVAQRFPADLEQLSGQRPLLRLAATGDQTAVRETLRSEEHAEREADRRYWKPLLAELQRLRWARNMQPGERVG